MRTRLRNSMRRSLAATKLVTPKLVMASRSPRPRMLVRGSGHRPPRRPVSPARPARSSSWLATIIVAPAAVAARSDGVELVAAGCVEAGMGLVEQPQLGAAGDQAGQRRAPPLTGRQLANRHVAAAGPARPMRSSAAADLVRRRADRRAPELDVLGDGEIGVEAVGVAEQADARPHSLTLLGEVETQHHRGATGQRQQPGAQSQQGGLAGAVGARAAARSPRAARSAWHRPAPGSGRGRPRRRRVERPDPSP